MAGYGHYGRLVNPKLHLATLRQDQGAKFDMMREFKRAIAAKDTELVIYILRMEKKALPHDKIYLKRTNFLGIEGKPMPLLEWAKKEHYEEIVDYLKGKSREGPHKMMEYVVEQDE